MKKHAIGFFILSASNLFAGLQDPELEEVRPFDISSTQSTLSSIPSEEPKPEVAKFSLLEKPEILQQLLGDEEQPKSRRQGTQESRNRRRDGKKDQKNNAGAGSSHAKIEGGVSYFWPQADILRDIYGPGINYHVTLSGKVYKHLDLWAGANYFNKDGKSLGSHKRTNIKIIPVSLGLKYLFFFNIDWVKVDFYFNAAFKYYFVKIHDHSNFVYKHSNKNGLGGVAGVGSYVHFTDYFFVNLLVDYSYKRFSHFHHKEHSKTHSLQVGGLDFGGGVGFQF